LVALFFNLGNIEGASKKVEELLNIDKQSIHVYALPLQGRIRIEEQRYEEAIESSKKLFH